MNTRRLKAVLKVESVKAEAGEKARVEWRKRNLKGES